MKSFVIILMVSFSLCVEASEPSDKKYEVEPRGKAAKFALITNLAIVIAAKVGLYTLILAIALVAASVKIAIMMAWATTIYKYVPDPYRYKTDRPYDPYNKGYNKQGYQTLDAIADFIRNRHFFYVVATKLFVLKMVYGALFYILLTKGWHFLLWFIHYLKKKSHHHHEYIDDHYEHDHGHHSYGAYDYSYGAYDHSYGGYDHQPYIYDKGGYGSDFKKKAVYDADGSYAVQGR